MMRPVFVCEFEGDDVVEMEGDSGGVAKNGVGWTVQSVVGVSSECLVKIRDTSDDDDAVGDGVEEKVATFGEDEGFCDEDVEEEEQDHDEESEGEIFIVAVEDSSFSK